MKNYKSIQEIETLDDGTMNVLLKNGKRAFIEIKRLNEKFEAAIYHMMIGDPIEEKRKTSMDILSKLSKHDAYKECAKEAIGWIDENPDQFLKAEEIRESKYK